MKDMGEQHFRISEGVEEGDFECTLEVTFAGEYLKWSNLI
jgi:hypothetical protein